MEKFNFAEMSVNKVSENFLNSKGEAVGKDLITNNFKNVFFFALGSSFFYCN